ncbi:heme lyase CcmF/NrfE family subunit [Chloroflexota bacterium]
MAELGFITLIAAIIAAVYSAVAAVVGVKRNSEKLIASVRTGILAVAVLYTIALAIILFSFATKDFSLKIVSDHASLDLPLVYSLSAIYANKTGSIFFWGWLVSLFTAVLAIKRNGVQRQGMPYALAILAIIEVFFLALATILTNIFTRNSVPPIDGFGLNPLLQNVAMFIHPTLLYMGFAGMAVVFAIALAALISRSRGTEWIAGIRRWSVFAWCLLGIGNLTGMWWAYVELGWGGYWAWDPVENAGIMPWLLATAFLHSIAMRKQRIYLQTWSMALVIFTFAFTLLSPFITHGGIESPLHGFQDSSFPPYILAAILITLIVSLTLLYHRRRDFETEKKPESIISKEGAFLTTNIILVILVLVIFTGTVLPGIIKGLGGADLALDRSFFDRTCGPIMLILVFLMGVCPLLGWGKTLWSSVKRDFMYVLPVILIISVIILITGAGNWYAAVPIVCGFPLYVIISEWYRSVIARHQSRGENPALAFLSMLWSRRARYGGFIVHIGIIAITLGIIGSSLYNIERTVTLDIGESVDIGKYELDYQELTFETDKSRIKAIATISVINNERLVKTLYPEYNYWINSGEYLAEVDYRTTLAEDIFVSLAWTSFNPDDKTVTIRALINPLIVWIWIGAGLVLSGGVVSFSLPGDKLNRIKS